MISGEQEPEPLMSRDQNLEENNQQTEAIQESQDKDDAAAEEKETV